MKLEAVVNGDEAFLHMERYVDEGAKSYSPFSARTEAAQDYRPEGGKPCFELITVNAPKERVSIFKADPSPSLFDHYVRPHGVLFAVHPQTWAADAEHLDEIHTLPLGAPIRVAPTASTRTVLALEHHADVPPHFIKLHYPVRISRFNRRLRRKNICNSVAVTNDIAHFHFDRFAYLPDCLGFTFGHGDSDWGFLLREAVPRPAIAGRFLIPCFALYAGDSKNPNDPPLLVQMIKRLDAEPVSFAIDEVLIPVVECWCKVVRERGFLLESHAQNTLLEIDREFRPCRIVHRDFDVWIDTNARRDAGLETPFIGVGIGTDGGRAREQYYSVVYDRFIGREFFDYLLAVLKRYYGIDGEFVRTRVREAFHRSFPDADRFFPARTMFYFAKEPPPGREFALEDMRQPPVWR